MKILVLEDNEYRIKTFRKIFNKVAQPTLFFVDNVKNAKEIYKKFKPFDFIFLDHDLDNRIMVNSKEENTGYQFVKYIIKDQPKGEIIVHSLNVVGANRMVKEFHMNGIECKYIPFYFLEESILGKKYEASRSK